MATLRELIDSIRHNADTQLEQNAALNRLLPLFDRLRQDVSRMLDNHEITMSRIDLRMRDIDGKLLILTKEADDTQTDVKDLRRDITQPRMKIVSNESGKQPAVAAAIGALEKLSTSTKILLLVLVTLLAASGWLTHLLK